MLNEKCQKNFNKKRIIDVTSYENAIHDIKIPLSILHTTLQILEGMKQMPDDAKDYLKLAKNSCYRIMKLMNDINDCAKIDNGYFYPTLTNYNVVALTRNITESTLLLASKKNISINFKTNIDNKIMGLDKDMLERILLNLLSNAIKFTGEGGQVDVIFIDKNQTVEIIVKDNGIGIDIEKINGIFKRYTTGDSKTGSGIGLSIVNELTKLLGGSLKVRKSNNEIGSEFIVILPVYMAKQTRSKTSHLDDFYSDNIVQIELSDDYF